MNAFSLLPAGKHFIYIAVRFCDDKDIFAFFEKAMHKFRRLPYACRTRAVRVARITLNLDGFW